MIKEGGGFRLKTKGPGKGDLFYENMRLYGKICQYPLPSILKYIS